VREVELASLRALPSLSAADLNARLAKQRDIEPAVWLIVHAREAIIRDIIADVGSTDTKGRDATEILGRSNDKPNAIQIFKSPNAMVPLTKLLKLLTQNSDADITSPH
jgi:hypothetical protein